ncbi:MAG: flagellar hook-basal body protein [Thermoleophilaceae bacterium]|nr:flagellar hook-basal body protein [Thermoleophilaceae bacterium]
MLEGLYSSAAGMAAQERRMDAVANDLANVSTTGYKRVRVAFRDLLYGNAPMRGAAPQVRTGAGAAASPIGRDFGQGSLDPTGRPLDVAIEGPGFFRVREPNGVVGLTRDGNFHIDPRGRLVTTSGAQVLPGIRVPAGTNVDEISIAADGTVSVGSRRLGRLDVVTVRSPDGLTALGDNLYAVSPASGPARRVSPATTALRQGMLESSNADIADAMVDMIEAQRSYSLAAKAIQTQDEMAGIANGVKQ